MVAVENTYFVRRRSITVQMTSCLTGLYSATLLMFNWQHIYLFGRIQTNQTGGQLYSNTSAIEQYWMVVVTANWINRYANRSWCKLGYPGRYPINIVIECHKSFIKIIPHASAKKVLQDLPLQGMRTGHTDGKTWKCNQDKRKSDNLSYFFHLLATSEM